MRLFEGAEQEKVGVVDREMRGELCELHLEIAAAAVVIEEDRSGVRVVDDAVGGIGGCRADVKAGGGEHTAGPGRREAVQQEILSTLTVKSVILSAFLAGASASSK